MMLLVEFKRDESNTWKRNKLREILERNRAFASVDSRCFSPLHNMAVGRTRRSEG